MKPLLIIGIGGALGSMCRYLAQVCVGKYTTLAFPFGTLVVNLTGCFLIGILFGMSNKYAWMTMEWRLFLITGICGGYTTFSSFSLESMTLMRQGNYTYLFLYILGSVTVGLLATIAGSSLFR
jgi:fluoride exporter